MNKRLMLLGVVLALGAVGTLFWVRAEAEAKKNPPAAPALKLAANRIVHVTVYQNSALVTREVDVPEGVGTMELVVSPLPAQTVNSSLYTEGGEGMRVLTTRFRLRPQKEDTREEVRKAEAQIKELQNTAQKIQSEIQTAQANLQMVTKLEGFTAANTVNATEKGKLDGDQIITLSDYVMKQRAEKAKEAVDLQQQLQTNQEQMEFARRQLQELAAGTSKMERDAIIIVDKTNAAGGKVRLNYLVDSASWRPQYRFRTGKQEKEALQIEYLAGVIQQTGEDWNNVKVTLSTAQPMLNAAPPDLEVLEVALRPRGSGPGQQPGLPMPPGFPGGQGGAPNQQAFQEQLKQQSENLRAQSRMEYNQKDAQKGGRSLNTAAALDQSNEILWMDRDDLLNRRMLSKAGGPREGQSVTYHLDSTLNVPSRNEEQVIEVTRIDMMPEFCYKAVPVLTPHVYRLANLTNKSKYVLLPGEATMYIGTDFVGRMDLPLVAIGEQFTAGFGVDPQLQVQRQMMDKAKTQQGGNQVLTYQYRILVSSYKTEPVKVQVWDRLPRTEAEVVNVTMVKTAPEICTEPLYVREHKANNVLRWDLKVEPAMNGEKALAVNYEFKMELDRQMQIGGFLSK